MKRMRTLRKAQIKEYGKPDRTEKVELWISLVFIIITSWANQNGFFLWPWTGSGFDFEHSFLNTMSAIDAEDVGVTWLNIQRNSILIAIASLAVMGIRAPFLIKKTKKKLASLQPGRLDTVVPLFLLAMLFGTGVWLYFGFEMMDSLINRPKISLILIVFAAFFMQMASLCIHRSFIFSIMFYEFGLKK